MSTDNKQTEYKVIFFNGDESIYYSFTVLGAFCAGTMDMNLQARDSRIKYIYDAEKDLTYSHFEFNYQTK